MVDILDTVIEILVLQCEGLWIVSVPASAFNFMMYVGGPARP